VSREGHPAFSRSSRWCSCPRTACAALGPLRSVTVIRNRNSVPVPGPTLGLGSSVPRASRRARGRSPVSASASPVVVTAPAAMPPSTEYEGNAPEAESLSSAARRTSASSSGCASDHLRRRCTAGLRPSALSSIERGGFRGEPRTRPRLSARPGARPPRRAPGANTGRDSASRPRRTQSPSAPSPSFLSPPFPFPLCTGTENSLRARYRRPRSPTSINHSIADPISRSGFQGSCFTPLITR